MKELQPIIKDGIVVNAEDLKKFYARRFEHHERIRHGMFIDLEYLSPSDKHYVDKISPPIAQDSIIHNLKQIRAELIHVHNQVDQQSSKNKTKKQKPIGGV